MDNCDDILSAAVERAFGRRLNIAFEYGHVYAGIEEELEPAVSGSASAGPEQEEVVRPAVPVQHTAENCLEGNTFSTFVVGEENRYAYAAATTAAAESFSNSISDAAATGAGSVTSACFFAQPAKRHRAMTRMSRNARVLFIFFSSISFLFFL